jgi:hypothetical protein
MATMATRSFDAYKNGFFDRPAVVGAMGRTAAAALSKGGAYVRREAKSSLRYRSKSSKPGQPPTVWRDDRPGGTFRTTKKKDGTSHRRAVSPLKEFIFFAWDPGRHDVIIGPAATNQISFVKGRASRGTIPGVLERGGQTQVLEVRRGRVWRRADLRSPRRYAGRPKRLRTINILARPFMMPALQRSFPSVLGEFAQGVGFRSRWVA